MNIPISSHTTIVINDYDYDYEIIHENYDTKSNDLLNVTYGCRQSHSYVHYSLLD